MTPSALEAVVRSLLAAYPVRVMRWRKSLSGVAWHVEKKGVFVETRIEAPRPRTPLSFSIFAHEIGHHLQHMERASWPSRMEQEHDAWERAFVLMREHGVPITEKVEKRFHDSMRYALAKALRRGARRVPQPFEHFLDDPYIQRVRERAERRRAGRRRRAWWA